MTAELFSCAIRLLADTSRLTVWLVLLIAIFVPLEQLCGLHPSKIWRKQTAVDITWYFINSILPATMLTVPLVLLSRCLYAGNPCGFYLAVGNLPFALKVALVLLVNDIGAYWGHRAMHAFPSLWRFHAVHHSAEHLDWLVNTRAHPFDMIFVRFSGLALVYLLGLAQTTGGRIDPVVAILMIFGTIWTFFIHANTRLRLGPLEWVLSSPAFHHWHHTNDERRDRNYAFVFPFIDRLFGTAWLPKYWPSAYGIDEKLPETLVGQFFAPFERTDALVANDGSSDSLAVSAQVVRDSEARTFAP
ncbi:MAG: sterol desaturase family protein [Acidobacteriota bacterium]|nr:sterol desaturase family protein [Acidobacteriota bacterium]